ncbi:thioesterase family protein [Hypoxylon argillaceum]|nr:thioesterase family protein [Hypoxylon argillaceum]
MASELGEQMKLRQTAPNTYSISWHSDWVIGLNIQKLHIEFLRGCVPAESSITVTPLKRGACAEAQRRDPNWLRFRLDDEVFPLTRHLLNMYPAAGFPHNGLVDGWIRITSDEDRIDATFLGAMCDLVPSLSDTGLRNGVLYDAHTNHGIVRRWAESQSPPGSGPPAVLAVKRETALASLIVHQTITLDAEFKHRLPAEGLRWVHTRAGTRMTRGGRMDLDIVLYDENMELVCVAQQLLVVVDSKRKFGGTQKPGSIL